MRSDSIELLHRLKPLTDGVVLLGPDAENQVKSTFRKILESGDSYNVLELEGWLAKNLDNPSEKVIDRVMNIAHYQKSKFEAENKFRMVSDNNECGCGGSH